MSEILAEAVQAATRAMVSLYRGDAGEEWTAIDEEAGRAAVEAAAPVIAEHARAYQRHQAAGQLAAVLAIGRDIWGGHRMTVSRISNRLTVVTGDIARLARDCDENGVIAKADMARELGNLILSTTRWADDLGLPLYECLAEAERAQREYVATRSPQAITDHARDLASSHGGEHGRCGACGRLTALDASVTAKQTEAAVARFEDLLGSIWLYIAWAHVTRRLTTEQKELFADAVDASHRRANAEDPDLKLTPVDRWWRDDALAATAQTESGTR